MALAGHAAELWVEVTSTDFSCLSPWRLALSMFLTFLIFNLIIYPIFSCPLMHVPGPYVSRVTSLWFSYHGYKNTSNQYIHCLHNRYGPVVRVTPNIVSFNSIEAIPAIYGVRSNFPKPSSASKMDNFGKPNTFSSISKEDHHRRRNRYASSYSRSVMTQGDGYGGILRRTRQVLVLIKDAGLKNKAVDIYKLFHYYSIDNSSVIASGTSMGLLDGRNLEFSQDLRDLFTGLSYVFYFTMASILMRVIPGGANRLIPAPVMKALQAHRRVQNMNMEHYKRSRDIQRPEFARAVLMRLQKHKDYGTRDLTDFHIASEISDHLLAGADTLVAGLVYTFWELARECHKIYLDRLISELMSIAYNKDGLPDSYVSVDKLVWLECCIREGLRLHTPSGHIQARIVPEGGAVIAGYSVPEKIEVGIPLYSIQLNSDIFEEAFLFKPQRWLEENSKPEKLRQMRLAWMTFGHGARICVGKELTMVQSKLLMATIFRHFTVTVDESMTEDDMEGLQMAVLAPKGGQCLLKFTGLKEMEI